MKRENGSGTIKFIGKNHRRPYGAIITVGWELKDGKAIQKRKSLGYFKTKAEARRCLEQYYLNPYDTEVTFETIYERWSATYYAENSYQVVKRNEKAFERSELLKDKPMAKIRLVDLEWQMERHSDITAVSKKSMKTLWSLMFEWAIARDFAQVNYARMLEVKSEEPKIKRTAFTKEEIQMLWDDESEISNLILVGIYSGWRPSELISFEIKGDVMVGGSKTEAGRNRQIPIHSKITHILAEIPHFSDYKEYRNAFNEQMAYLGLNHYPHDTRHTFATLCDQYDVKPEVTKMLMGHSQNGVTEKVYTHRTLETLKKEIEKIQ